MVATLLYSIAGGMLSILATTRVEQIAWKFLHLAGFIVLAITSGVTVWCLHSSPPPLDMAMKTMVGLGALVGTGAIIVVLASPLCGRWTRSFRLVCALFGPSSTPRNRKSWKTKHL